MTVDWTRWMEDREELLKQYRAIVQHEIDMAKLNKWQRLTDALWGRRP
jgi:hypothetical protein